MPIIQVWLYGRVSTAKQSQEGLSIEAQTERLQRFIEYRFPGNVDATTNQTVKVMWPPAIDQATSGKVEFICRPAGKKVWEHMNDGDHIAVVKLDRLFRNMKDFVVLMDKFKSRNIHVHLLDYNVDATTSMGELMLNVMASFGQFERQQISQRTAEVIRYKRRNGLVFNGNMPYGYKRRGADAKTATVVPDLEERKLCRWIVNLSEPEPKGKGLSDTAIARYLQANKQVFRGTNKWDRTKVYRLKKAATLGFPLGDGMYMDDSGCLREMKDGL